MSTKQVQAAAAPLQTYEPLKLLINAPSEEDRLKSKSFGCYYSNLLIETKTEGRLITRTRDTQYWACFTGPYIALHEQAPTLDDTGPGDTLPAPCDYVVLSPGTTFTTSGNPNDPTFTLSQVFLNRTVSMVADSTRTFRCASEREVEEWRCAIQSVVEVLRGDFSLPTPPAQPSPPRIESIKHDAVRLSWLPEGSPGTLQSTLPTLHYLVQTKQAKEEWSSPILVHALTPYVVVRDLKSGTPYTWRVCATNVLGEGKYSTPSAQVSTLQTPRTAPSAPLVVGRGTEAVTLTWTGAKSGGKEFWGVNTSPVHSININAYLCGDKKKHTVVCASQQFNSTVGKCTGVLAGLTPGTAYVFKACAVSYAGNGVFGKESKQ